MNPKPNGRRYAPEYLEWVIGLPCRLRDRVGGCSGRTEADHLGLHPGGRKADDVTAIPLCSLHHAQRHAHAGWFRAMDKTETRAWRLDEIRAVQAMWLEAHDQLPGL